jgi:hypothetical protein
MSTVKDDTTPSVPAVVDVETLVNAAVAFINNAAKETVYQGYLKIGRYLLERFFNNNIGVSA